jgi:hypothetical protein
MEAICSSESLTYNGLYDVIFITTTVRTSYPTENKIKFGHLKNKLGHNINTDMTEQILMKWAGLNCLTMN